MDMEPLFRWIGIGLLVALIVALLVGIVVGIVVGRWGL